MLIVNPNHSTVARSDTKINKKNLTQNTEEFQEIYIVADIKITQLNVTSKNYNDNPMKINSPI